MADLTKPQADLLAALRYTPDYTPASYLLPKLTHHTEQGLHQTAASLVRKGYLLKRRQFRTDRGKLVGPIAYCLAPKGVEWLQAADSLAAQAAR